MNSSNNLISNLSFVFVSVQTLAAVATFIIAILLYDKFGLNSKLIEKKVNIVLNLVGLLRDFNFGIKGREVYYFVRAKRGILKKIQATPSYRIDYQGKILILSDDYVKLTRSIISLSKSYWMPIEIRKKLEFLQVLATTDVDRFLNDSFVRLVVGMDNNSRKYKLMLPELTFGAFINNIYMLIEETDKWIKKYADIKIDFFDEEYDAVEVRKNIGRG